MMALMMQMYQTTYESGVCLVVLLSENFWNLEFQWIGFLQVQCSEHFWNDTIQQIGQNYVGILTNSCLGTHN